MFFFYSDMMVILSGSEMNLKKDFLNHVESEVLFVSWLTFISIKFMK